MAQATARHILVDSEAKCEELKSAIEGGQDFGEVNKVLGTVKTQLGYHLLEVTSRSS